MQLVQLSKFFSVRTHSIGTRANWGYVAIFSNAEKFQCLYSYYGSCIPSSLKESISPCYNDIHDICAWLWGSGIMRFWYNEVLECMV